MNIINNNTTNNTVNTNNRKNTTSMKTMTTRTKLRTLTLAAAAGLMALASSPVAEAVQYHSHTTFASGLDFHINDGDHHYYAGIQVGDFSKPGVISITNNTIVELIGGSLNIGSACAGFMRVDVSSQLIAPSNEINVRAGDALGLLWIDGGYVNANYFNLDDQNSPGESGHLYITNGGILEVYSSVNLGQQALVSIDLDGLAASGTPSIIIHGDLFINSPGALLEVESGQIYAPGTEFNIMEVFGSGGVDPYLFGPSFVAPVTGQEFLASGDGTNIILTAQAIPEPSTYALIGGVGAVALALLARRRRRG
ncbi:MAG: PEP-CTERM sorting domain-containing protein [Puniceicoccales bacterium]|jgi:hypothetical protein|nr:PEP-CTERM sorting domain-containing protein [Puniceicoccales bacterium]